MKPFATALPIVLMIAACSNAQDAQDHRGEIAGTPSDVKTAAGSYDGFSVTRPCSESAVADVGVRGLGRTTVTDRAEMYALAGELERSMPDVTSIYLSSTGLQCDGDYGASISLTDWREVDEVIRRTGAFLRDRDLALSVSVNVESMAVAH